MADIELAPIYSELLDFLIEKATPQEILVFEVSQAALERAELLTERNKGDRLTPTEAAELEQMLEFDQLVSLLKAKALELLEP